MFMQMNFADEVSLKILTVLAQDPQKEYYQREIAKTAGVSAGATSQKLRALVDSGLVSVKKSGKMLFYRYDLDNPVARQFKILLNVNALQKLIRELQDKARRVTLFGSAAEGTNVQDSDIDLMVLSEDGREIRKLIGDYSELLGKKISPIVVNAGGLRQMRVRDKPLYERIGRGIVLWERK
jgi:predicted nucleotidyltransferase